MIHQHKTHYITLKDYSGCDVVTEQKTSFSGDAPSFLTFDGRGFKKIFDSSNVVVYSQVTYCDLSLIVTNNGN
ncbi:MULTISPECIES: hypothetical protein [unclassified Microcoleus]|uniref:hypothetical protein n=1 Tax=unclassified Microcoleus TaxID=2642155 RepID=UPI002FD5B413